MTPTFVHLLLIFNVIFNQFINAQRICNNSPNLCGRPFSNITSLGAHDSPFVRNSSNQYTVAGDQIYSSLTQLDAGVRLLTAQVHNVTTDGKTDYHLCHSLCALYDAGTLLGWLESLNSWLLANPDDVITILIVNSDKLSATTLHDIFHASGIDALAYAPEDTTQPLSSWPTLEQLITQNKRLITFIASLDPSSNTVAPYLLDEFTFAFENDYDVTTLDGFPCAANRPASLNGNTAAALSSGRLPLMNHFKYDNLSGIEISDLANASAVNGADADIVGSLANSAANCTSLYGRPPTFALVDFVNIGDAIAVVDRINNVVGSTSGRLVLPDTANGSMADPNPVAASSSANGIGSATATATTKGSSMSSGTGAASGTSARSSAASSARPNDASLAVQMVPALLALPCVLTGLTFV